MGAGGSAFCPDHRLEMRAHFGVIRVDLQGSPQFDDRVIELPLAGQRDTQHVVRDRVVRPQKQRLPRVGLGLFEGPVLDQRTRQVSPRGRVLGVQLHEAPELHDGLVGTAQGHVGDPQLHHRADVVRAVGEELLILAGRLLVLLLPQQGFGEDPVHVAVGRRHVQHVPEFLLRLRKLSLHLQRAADQFMRGRHLDAG